MGEPAPSAPVPLGPWRLLRLKRRLTGPLSRVQAERCTGAPSCGVGGSLSLCRPCDGEIQRRIDQVGRVLQLPGHRVALLLLLRGLEALEGELQQLREAGEDAT